ncbi:site-specific DNA-methyltransferase [Candidatus Roizmanbacteria bacterium]|nr:site-specific DNA-methyltransferase [Candidatus Roizmanbacteria bacterium]
MALTKKYNNYSREELINELESLKRKKYGLVWDKKNSQENLDVFVNWENMPEKFVPKQFPVLKEITDKEIKTESDKPTNILIEGDNYHSLAVLNFTHQKKIDVIYIDPPYNTGNQDFIYNDKFIDKEDPFRHSKWLSFMEKRLRLSFKLLKNTGVIFISIDDNEQAQLKLLCDEIFGEDNFIANISRRTKSAGKTTETIASNHDYVVIYSKDRQKVKFSSIFIDDSAYKHKDEYYSERGPYALSQTLDYDSLSYSDSLDYELKLNNQLHYPGGDKKVFLERKGGKHRASDWTWRWGKELVEFGNKQGFVVVKKGKNGKPRIYTKTYFKVVIEKVNGKYTIVPIVRTKNLSTLDLMESSYSNDVSKKDIRSIFGNYAEFAYPKPLSLLKYLINTIPNQNNSIILDFFTGSGTTGQAVLELNKEDKGNRKFILCTNNENNICTDVCYPRIEKVINGYKNSKGEKVAGLGGSLKYFKTDFVGSDSTDKNKRGLVNKSAEMICIKEDIFDLVVDNGQDFKIFQKGKKFLGVIYNLDAITDFKKEAEKFKGNFVIYCFSYTETTPEKEFKGLKNKYILKPIPAVILRIYLEIFKK